MSGGTSAASGGGSACRSSAPGKAYDYYLSAAGNVSYQLARAGAAVISGCAVGTDSYAHLGCMRGGGPTVGALAGGI